MSSTLRVLSHERILLVHHMLHCSALHVCSLMGVFTRGWSGSLAVAAAAPCHTARKAAMGKMLHNSFGGHVLAWAPSHNQCFPCTVRDSHLSTLGGRVAHSKIVENFCIISLQVFIYSVKCILEYCSRGESRIFCFFFIFMILFIK